MIFEFIFDAICLLCATSHEAYHWYETRLAIQHDILAHCPYAMKSIENEMENLCRKFPDFYQCANFSMSDLSFSQVTEVEKKQGLLALES